MRACHYYLSAHLKHTPVSLYTGSLLCAAHSLCSVNPANLSTDLTCDRFYHSAQYVSNDLLLSYNTNY